MPLSLQYNINSVISSLSVMLFVLHCELRLYGFGRFLVFFLYTFSYEVFILFFIEFTLVIVLLVGIKRWLSLLIYIYIYIYYIYIYIYIYIN